MFDDNPVLKERLMGVGAFAGIAMFALGAVDVLVTGGFDFADERAPYDRAQPSAYVQVVDAAEYVSDQVQRISWNDTFSIGEAQAATTEDLVGENDGSPTPEVSQTSDDELLQAVAALYAGRPAEDEASADQAHSAEAYSNEAYADDYPAEDEKLASASENASPW
ncbi:MAG: hypothetical protein NT015_11850 [Alphaproteobacteria bacterium]|nr:hypothetical protein [Alphaproteobacteria bacterium]